MSEIKTEPRIVVWFSAGAASAVACKLVLAEGHENVHICYTDPGNEHEDNKRFIQDCEEWFDHPITKLKNPKWVDAWDIWENHGYLVSPYGAMCTTELKKKMRQKFQEDDDVQVFGYTAEEEHRAKRFREQNIEVNLRTPLIEQGLTKSDCLSMIDRAGIALPAMYLLGYQNNNCVGCVKGGMGYWNKIRRDFPDVFTRMANVERKLDVSILKDGGGRLFLDELEPNRGNHEDEPSFECSLLCQIAEDKIDG